MSIGVQEQMGIDIESEIEKLYSARASYNAVDCTYVWHNGVESKNISYESAEMRYEDRYQISHFLVDPLTFRFRKVIRILSLVNLGIFTKVMNRFQKSFNRKVIDTL